MDKKKTFGITATALYSAFSSVLCLASSTLMMFAGLMGEGSLFYILASILVMVLGISLGASVYGLWTLQRWGRKLTVTLYVISGVLSLIVMFLIFPGDKFSIANIILQSIGIVVSVAIIRHLTRERIITLFD